MKKLTLTTAALLLCAATNAHALPQSKVDSKTLHVDGTYANNDDVSIDVEVEKPKDNELQFLRNELSNVKGLKTGYKQKAKVYMKLSQESEELKDEFEGYLDNRVDYEHAISGYNTLVECLKSGDAKKCTGKKKKKKSEKKESDELQLEVNVQTGATGNASYGTDSTYSDSIEIRQAARRRAPRKSYSKNYGKRYSSNGFVREVDNRVAMRQSDLIACYKRSGLRDEGVLKVVLKIAPNGNLNHLGFKDTTHVNDRALINCVTRVLYSIVYPQTPNRKVVAVSKPFVFNKI